MKKLLRSLVICILVSMFLCITAFAGYTVDDVSKPYPIYTFDTVEELENFAKKNYTFIKYNDTSKKIANDSVIYTFMDGKWVISDLSYLFDEYKVYNQRAKLVCGSKYSNVMDSPIYESNVVWLVRHGTVLRGDMDVGSTLHNPSVSFDGVNLVSMSIDRELCTSGDSTVVVYDDGREIVAKTFRTYCYGEDWHTNETHHWKVCTECGTECFKEEHTMVDGTCAVCSYSNHIHNYVKKYYTENGVENAYYIMECECGDQETGDKIYTHFKIFFDTNDGNGTFDTIDVQAGQTVSLPTEEPTKDNFTFAGWSTERTGNVEYSAGESIKPLGNITLYAIFIGNPVTVNFDAGTRTTNPASIEVAYNGLYGELPVLSAEGYTFSGWELEDGTRVTSTTVVTISEEHTLNAIWGEVLWNVTFVSNDRVETLQVIDKAVVDPPFEVTTAGLIFRHWSLTRTGSSFDFNTPITEDITLYAVCDGIDVHIYAGTMVYTKKYPEEIGELLTVPMAGKKFVGWSYDQEGTQLVKPTDTVPPYDITLYPVYEEYVYHLVLKDVATIDISYDSTIPELPVPDVDGKTFLGWYFLDVPIQEGQKYRWEHDIEVIPRYEPVRCVVKHPNGDVTVVEYGNIIGTIHNATLPKGKRISHYVDASCNTVDYNTVVYSNIVISPVYVNFNVVLTLKDKEWETSLTVESATKIDYLPTRTKPGYTFEGWTMAESGASSVTTGPFDRDVTLYAKYTANKQSIYLSDMNQTVECFTDAEIGSLPIPTKDGYDFEYWMYNGVKVDSSFIVPAENITLTAKWTPVHIDTSNTIEVRFWVDGVKINTIDLNPGEILYDPGAPALNTVDDRLFERWAASSGGSTYVFGRRLYADLDLYAMWK